MGAGDFTPALVRRLFFERDGEACFLCRRGLRWEDRGQGWSAHHRKPRGKGGTSNTSIGSAANCLILCGSGTTGCHGWAEHFRAKAIAAGILISANGVGPEFDPTAVRVQRDDSTWWLLTASGRAVEVEGGTR